MSNVFNINRFWKYFRLDLLNSWRNYGLSAIICGCIPIILYLVIAVFALLTDDALFEINTVTKFFAYFIAFFVVTIGFPAIQYGKITDRSLGSDYLMLPASTLEKFLSMLLVCCVALPFVLGCLLVGSDILLSLVAPHYGDSAISLAGTLPEIMRNNEVPFTFNLGYLLWLSWCSNILFFALGAIIFKKSKVAKTFLADFALAFLLSILSTIFCWIFFGSFSIDNSTVTAFLESMTPERAQRIINLYINASFFISCVILDLALFFRLKTIKH